MPELPEVQTVVDTLSPKILGRAITAVILNRVDVLQPIGFDLAKHLAGRKVSAIHRRGKKIIFLLDDGNRFYIHLGMTGRLTADSIETPFRPHTHLLLNFTGNGAPQVRFTDPRRFGGIWWLGSQSTGDDKMGPEPLLIRPTQLAARLAKTSRAIKSALLDQSVIAGLGNIYVDESLFRANIHPLTPANKLTNYEIVRLNRAIKQTLRRALRHRGSTLRDYADANGKAAHFKNYTLSTTAPASPAQTAPQSLNESSSAEDPPTTAQHASRNGKSLPSGRQSIRVARDKGSDSLVAWEPHLCRATSDANTSRFVKPPLCPLPRLVHRKQQLPRGYQLPLSTKNIRNRPITG